MENCELIMPIKRGQSRLNFRCTKKIVINTIKEGIKYKAGRIEKTMKPALSS